MTFGETRHLTRIENGTWGTVGCTLGHFLFVPAKSTALRNILGSVGGSNQWRLSVLVLISGLGFSNMCALKQRLDTMTQLTISTGSRKLPSLGPPWPSTHPCEQTAQAIPQRTIREGIFPPILSSDLAHYACAGLTIINKHLALFVQSPISASYLHWLPMKVLIAKSFLDFLKPCRPCLPICDLTWSTVKLKVCEAGDWTCQTGIRSLRILLGPEHFHIRRSGKTQRPNVAARNKCTATGSFQSVFFARQLYCHPPFHPVPVTWPPLQWPSHPADPWPSRAKPQSRLRLLRCQCLLRTKGLSISNKKLLGSWHRY